MPARREAAATGILTTAALIAGSVGGAEAQTAPGAALPPVTVDPPKVRPRPAVRPTQQQSQARAAIRRAAPKRTVQAAKPAPSRNPAPAAAPAAPAPGPSSSTPIIAQLPDGNPYANPQAPYMAQRLQGNKFTEPLLNTPKTVTVVTKEVLQDRNLTSLKDVARTTNGITIGTGEGGNAFGDRFFIRGFDARSDVFVDGIRDTSVNIRENFFTEQIEILRGPGSTFAGRGVAGGAINIVTKAAADKDFYRADVLGGTTSDQTKRVVLDLNHVVTPDFAVRLGGMYQDAGVAGRNLVTDDRWGAAIATKMTPTDWLKITTSYIHTDINMLPDFGVPFYRQNLPGGAILGNLRPATESFLDRRTYYGYVNRDFQKSQSDLATIRFDAILGDGITLSNASRYGRSVLDYIGTLPQGPNYTNANPNLWTVNTSAQSMYAINQNMTNQTDLTFKYDTGPVKHTTVVGTELVNERVWQNNYTGLSSEINGVPVLGGSRLVYMFFPPNFVDWSAPIRGGASSRRLLTADTASAYIIETANFNDFIILNGGLRYDNYKVGQTQNSLTAATASNSVSSQVVNWNAGITVKPVKEMSIYAAAATSANPLGAEFDSSSLAYGGISSTPNAQNNALPPELNTAYEVGIKYEMFDGKLLATAAYFDTYKDRAREAVGTVYVATGRYRVNGFDFGLSGKITDKWSVFGGATFFETDIEKSIDPTAVGRRLANIANQSFSMLTKYQVLNWLELGAAANYRSEIWGGTFAANQNKLPGYWRFDAFLEAKVNQNFKVGLNVQNIFDKTYYDAFYRSAVPFVFIAPGRTVTLSATAKF